VAPQDIEYLREFVEAGLPQEGSDPGDSRVAVAGQLEIVADVFLVEVAVLFQLGLGVVDHGAELENPEGSPVFSQAVLPEEDAAPGVRDLDEDRNQHDGGKENDQGEQRSEEIHQPLGNQIVPGRVYEPVIIAHARELLLVRPRVRGPVARATAAVERVEERGGQEARHVQHEQEQAPVEQDQPEARGRGDEVRDVAAVERNGDIDDLENEDARGDDQEHVEKGEAPAPPVKPEQQENDDPGQGQVEVSPQHHGEHLAERAGREGEHPDLEKGDDEERQVEGQDVGGEEKGPFFPGSDHGRLPVDGENLELERAARGFEADCLARAFAEQGLAQRGRDRNLVFVDVGLEWRHEMVFDVLVVRKVVEFDARAQEGLVPGDFAVVEHAGARDLFGQRADFALVHVEFFAGHVVFGVFGQIAERTGVLHVLADFTAFDRDQVGEPVLELVVPFLGQIGLVHGENLLKINNRQRARP